MSKDMMSGFELLQPDSVDGAVDLLGRFGDEAWALAGGNDSLDWFKDRVKRPQYVVDLSGLDEPGQVGNRQKRQLFQIRGDGGRLDDTPGRTRLLSVYRIIGNDGPKLERGRDFIGQRYPTDLLVVFAQVA